MPIITDCESIALKKASRSNRLCKSTLLKRGWTQKTIDALLPPPVKIVNPHYKKANAMLVWDENTVLECEKSDMFLNAKAKKQIRTEAGLKSAETKKQQLLSHIEKCNITVEEIPYDVLYDQTIKAKQDWYDYQDSICFQFNMPNDPANADYQTQIRWQVNYIRHNLTQYDDMCLKLFNQVGKQEGYILLRAKTLDAIAKAYPYLADECEKQKYQKY